MFRILYIALAFTLVFSSLRGVSQSSSRVFSQSKSRKQPQVSKIEIEKNLKYAESIFDDSISKAVKLVETNLLIAIENQFKPEEALGYQILAKFNHSLSNYSIACSNYEKALKIIKNENQNDWYLEVLKGAALSFEKNNKLDKAISLHREVVKLVSSNSSRLKNKSKNNNTTASFYSQWKIGELELVKKQLVNSKKSFKTLLDESTTTKNYIYQIKATIGLGKVEMEQNNFASAQSYFEYAQKLAESKEKDQLANEAFDLLAILFEKQQNLNKSISVQKQALSYNNSRGNVNSALNNSNNISQNYLKQGRSKEAMEIIEISKPLLKSKDNTLKKREFINTVSKIYEEEGLDEQADKAKKKYETLVDSFNYNQQQKLLIEEAKNEFLLNVQNKMLLMEKDRELNEQTIELLKKDQDIQNETIKQQKTITILLIIGLLIISFLGFLLFKNNGQRKRNNKLLILKSLRTQMNPHFIFNSLNSVNSFIAKKDEKSANKYLAEFSKLMREVLECSQEDFIPLSKEIELLKRYLKLEHFRFNSDFDYTFEVDERIVLDNYQIPPMLLQPFVENAIWHGLRYKEDKGILNVKFEQEQDFLRIVITDDGIGRTHSIESKTSNQKKMKSTGIKNVENRLEIIKSVFKKELSIDIQDLDKTNKSGTKVELKLY